MLEAQHVPQMEGHLVEGVRGAAVQLAPRPIGPALPPQGAEELLDRRRGGPDDRRVPERAEGDDIAIELPGPVEQPVAAGGGDEDVQAAAGGAGDLRSADLAELAALREKGGKAQGEGSCVMGSPSLQGGTRACGDPRVHRARGCRVRAHAGADGAAW